MRQYFDPLRYRVVLFDQRGCGRSRPLGCLQENTTWHLVSDIEALREDLGIQAWMVFGGSWGSTLGMAYAQQHSDRVTGMVLRGAFMLRQRELEWIYQYGGASAIFPDAWQAFEKIIPAAERDDMLGAYYRRLESSDRSLQLKAARAWSAWEASTSNLIIDPGLVNTFTDEKIALTLARIECHYFVHGGFLENESQLFDGIDAIRSIPAVIVQGRYDAICPVENAWRLHHAWPESKLIVVPDAGHSGFEPGIRHHLIRVADEFKE